MAEKWTQTEAVAKRAEQTIRAGGAGVAAAAAKTGDITRSF
jgi:hypothetical protein